MLQAKTNHKNLRVQFKLRAPGTPIQNSLVERKFPTLFGRASARMTHPGLMIISKGNFCVNQYQ